MINSNEEKPIRNNSVIIGYGNVGVYHVKAYGDDHDLVSPKINPDKPIGVEVKNVVQVENITTPE